jgi:uncharacterized protein (DUF486 family)
MATAVTPIKSKPVIIIAPVTLLVVILLSSGVYLFHYLLEQGPCHAGITDYDHCNALKLE